MDELLRYAESPKYAHLVVTLPLEKKIRLLESAQRSKRAEIKQMTGLTHATALAEATFAAQEYRHEMRRLQRLHAIGTS